MHPPQPDTLLIGHYHPGLVTLSVVIACIAAYAALDLGGRVTSARGRARPLWLAGGAVAMGTGIWSMHYIGMLAFNLPVPVRYDWPTVLVSWLAAVAASGVALTVVSQPRLGLLRAVIGSIFMGSGIAAMHYIGMAAMRLPAMHHYSTPIVTLSVVLAMVISMVALWLTFSLRGEVPAFGWKKLTSAVVMGAAIPVMHYTGMAAASFSPAPLAVEDTLYAVSVSSLGMTGIVAATLMVLTLVLVTSMVDRHFSVQVSGRKRAETALVDSRRTYEVTFDAAPIGIAHITPDGRWLRANQRLCDLLGYESHELSTTDLLALTHADDVSRCEEAKALVLLGGPERQVFQARLRRGDRQYIWTNVTISANRTTGSDPTHLVVLVEDITERRNLEEQVRQTQKMEAVGRLAAGIAHDFNNLLTVIIGFAEHTAEQMDEHHRSRRDLEQVLVAGRSAAALTRQLLAFSRRQMLRPQSVSLNVSVAHVEGLLKRAVGEDVRLSLALADHLDPVHVDPGQVEQVLMNLVVNARDAMPNGGMLTISTSNVSVDQAYVQAHEGASTGPHVRLSVQDTGTGIPDEAMAHLFEPFFTTKERGHGTGLGLATVYGIVKQSGGWITVETDIGRGTTFHVFLPRSKDPASGAALPASEGVPEGGSETILVAEDQPEVAAVIRATLERRGYTVIVAANGRLALSEARAHPQAIDLLLTDVLMPGMTGRELAEKLERDRPTTRVLYTSAYTDHAIVQHGVIEPRLQFIQKPFSPTELLRKVRQVLDGPPQRPDSK